MTPSEPQSELTPRQRDIVHIVRDQGFATLEALAEKFDVSTQTVRRDIIDLSKQGILQRFHGGAGLPNNMVRLGHEQKNRLAAEGKQLIGEKTAKLIPNGSAIFLDVGTTAEAVARALGNHRNLRIVTNSLLSATIVSAQSHSEIHVIGGTVHGNDGSLVGPDTDKAVRRFALDFAIIGCSGFDEHAAPLDHDMQKVAVKTAATRTAKKNILIADHTKLTRKAFLRINEASAFHLLVTDQAPDEAFRRSWTQAGGDILVPQ